MSGGILIPMDGTSQLERFDLDLDSGFLNLTFNEVVDAVSFTSTLISFSSSNNTLCSNNPN